MKKIPLSIYVENHGQHKTAEELGLTQCAISKALRGKKISLFILIQGKLGQVKSDRFHFSQINVGK